MTVTADTTLLTGNSLIAGAWVAGTERTVTGFDPRTDEALEPTYTLINAEQLEAATSSAAEASQSFADLDPDTRAAFLDSIADNLENVREVLVARASAETGLPTARLTGETGRTVGQLRLFAKVLRSGLYHRVRVDPAQPERTPAPRADIRQRMIPLGPVAVFGASNFPLAFSTAGGDTASALAAGCPVVFKAHNAHPGTSEIVGHAIADAIAAHELHPGVFSLVYGAGSSIGQALAADPRITAIGFTGSRGAGTALMATASARPVPIPVYAEMSAVNPVFVFPGAVEEPKDAEAIANGFFGSVTGSSGQLCTSPGVIFVPEGDEGDFLLNTIAGLFAGSTGQTMLTKGIAEAWHAGVEHLSSQPGVARVAIGTDGEGKNAPAPVVFTADISAFLANGELQAEIFGAASLVVRYANPAELVKATEVMEGQLTATVHAAEADYADVAVLLPRLERLAGRVLFGGWPTGVEVNNAVVHGGPFPATSDSRTTSVGTLAIERFQRPVAYQNIPEALLPAPLQDANPLGVARLVDGEPA